MLFVKVKIAIAVLLLVAVVGSGAGLLTYRPGDGAGTAEPEKLASKSGVKQDKAKPPTPEVPKVQPEPAKAKGPNRAKDFIDRLSASIDFDGFDDPKMTLEDALAHLADRYELTFDVDAAAFGEAGYTDKSVLSEPIAVTPIPRMRGVRLTTVLRKVLSRITTPRGKEATYMLRPDHILITTSDKAWHKMFPNNAMSEVLPGGVGDVVVVNVVLDKRPLGEALLELAASEALNLVMDPRVDEKAKTLVSATLLNVPADTAVRVLADMADLQPAFLDNVIYVTTKDNAKRLEQEPKKRPEAKAKPK